MKPTPKFKSLKERIDFYFKDVDTFPGRMTDFSIIVFILLVSVIYVVLTYPVSEQLRTILFGIETIIMVFFTIEYVLRFYVAEEKIKHTLSIYSLIDLVVILPFVFGFIELGFLRIFRVFRILRLIRFMKSKYLFGRLTHEEEYIGANLLFTIFAIIFVSSGMMYQIESSINPSINTFFDATYYMVISLTTVGFGDIIPVSTGGRAVTLLAIAAGIIFIPIQISTFFRKMVEKVGKVRRICKGCGLHYHEPDATHCKGCGHRVFNMKREG